MGAALIGPRLCCGGKLCSRAIRKGHNMDTDVRAKAANPAANRAARRRLAKKFGMLKGATRKRTASLKVVR